jgi:hypothetical protein
VRLLEARQQRRGRAQRVERIYLRFAVYSGKRRGFAEAAAAVVALDLDQHVLGQMLGAGGDSERLSELDVPGLEGHVADAHAPTVHRPSRAELGPRMAKSVDDRGRGARQARRDEGAYCNM